MKSMHFIDRASCTWHVGSSAETPLVDFHHRLAACPSYQKEVAKVLFATSMGLTS